VFPESAQIVSKKVYIMGQSHIIILQYLVLGLVLCVMLLQRIEIRNNTVRKEFKLKSFATDVTEESQ
jgi:hypothetical protein